MPAVYQLFGYPGTGKLTIAQEIVRLLAERGEPCARLDNHATHNLVWQLIPAERKFEPAICAADGRPRVRAAGARTRL